MSFRERFQRFMYGRYGLTAGVDGFSRFLLIASFVVLILSAFVRIGIPQAGYVMYAIALFLIVFSYFRFFSKNLSARTKENYKYYEILNKIKGFFTKSQAGAGYKLFRCPGCGKKVRVPKNKGKIEITCRNCHTTFIRFTGIRK